MAQPHNADYVAFLESKAQAFHLPAVLHARCHNVDAGRIDAAVAQDVRQLGDILLHPVERTGKQLAQVVRKDLAGLHARLFAERLHLCPDIASIVRLSTSGDENHAGADAAFGTIKAQTLSKQIGVVLVFIIMRWIRSDEAAFGLCTRNKKCQPPILL